MERLVCSIQAHGFWQHRPIAISTRTGQEVVICGNQRLKAAQQLGLSEVPVVIYRDLDETSENDIILRDNVNNGEWDFEAFNASRWQDVNFEEIGIELPKIDITPDECGESFSLPSGEKGACQHMGFVLANEQVQVIRDAIDKAKNIDEYRCVETFGNSNTNGNALYLIVSQWVGQKK